VALAGRRQCPHGLRRLTATQLSRTLTQILGEDRGWTAMLPEESGGFEAWPDAQPTTPLHVDAWLQVASAAADAVLERAPAEQRFEAEAIAPAPKQPIDGPSRSTPIMPKPVPPSRRCRAARQRRLPSDP
jgi:hypothetical protein